MQIETVFISTPWKTKFNFKEKIYHEQYQDNKWIVAAQNFLYECNKTCVIFHAWTELSQYEVGQEFFIKKDERQGGQ